MFYIIFFGIPALLILLWAFCFYGYRTVKTQNDAAPGTVSPEELKKRKTFLIIVSVVTGVLLAVVIGFILLLTMAVAFM